MNNFQKMVITKYDAPVVDYPFYIGYSVASHLGLRGTRDFRPYNTHSAVPSYVN